MTMMVRVDRVMDLAGGGLHAEQHYVYHRHPKAGDVLTGTAHYVLGGDVASALLVLATDGDTTALFEVDPAAEGVTRRRVPTMDPTRSLAEVSFSGVTGTRVPCPSDLVERLRSVAVIAVSAEQVGAAQAALDLTVEYTKNRKQFGRVIGSFQALKHRMADMYALVETARSMSYAAALSQDPQDAYAAIDNSIGADLDSGQFGRMLMWSISEGIQPDRLLGQARSNGYRPHIDALWNNPVEPDVRAEFDSSVVAALLGVFGSVWDLYEPYMIELADNRWRSREDLRQEVTELLKLLVYAARPKT